MVSGRSPALPRYDPETQPLALPATPFYAHTPPFAHMIVVPASIDKIEVWKLPSGDRWTGLLEVQPCSTFSGAKPGDLCPSRSLFYLDAKVVPTIWPGTLCDLDVCLRDGPSILESSKALIISPCPTSL